MTQQETPSTTNLLLRVDTPPYMHLGLTIEHMMRYTFIALMPAAILACLTFGLSAARVMALAMGTAVLTEAVCLYLMKRTMRIYDGTALVGGLLFAFLLPASAPWWLVIVGSSLMIILGKQVFGGLGCNPLCPPLVAWAVLTLSWPAMMDPESSVLNTTLIDPLIRLKLFGASSLDAFPLLDLLAGKQLGGLGSVYIGVLILGGLFLISRKVIRWEIPFGFLAAVLITGTIYWKIDPSLYIAPHMYLLTGTTVFAAFFLATDHSSSPVAFYGMLLFGLLAGCLTVIIRIYGVYPDGAPFAVLLSNLMTPFFDMIRPAPWGKGATHA